ncbi:MAG: glycosyltransferase family 1 protein, partial [Lachnospiraceae bacterium]|nr:glycosyltransferase family 1 protein [Lachnospiraceae bacterium]
MKIVFVSNYINHHQIPFCRAMAASSDVEFTFVQLMPMEEERVRMGWDKALGDVPFLKCMYDDAENIRREILECDAALFGWSDCEDLIYERLRAGKIVIRVSERIYREGQWKRFSPRGLYAKYHEHIRYRDKEAYLLCAGAYVASDFSLIRAYPGKMFKWGYFPELRTYSEERIRELSAGRSADEKLRLMFAGR